MIELFDLGTALTAREVVSSKLKCYPESKGGKMKTITRLSLTPFTLATLALVSTNCNDSNFRGSSGKKNTTPVNPASSTPPKECVKLEQSRSVNLALIIDNSGSNIRKSTDANLPGSDCVLKSPNDLVCQEATNRELAALAAVNVLAEKEKASESLKGKNKFAVIKFPEESHRNESIYNSTAAIASDWASVTDTKPDMSFTRRPEGFTPLKRAIELAAESMREANILENGNSNFAVIISDGGATDPEPMPAEDLRKLFPVGTQIAVYMLVDASKWLPDHAQFMRSTGIFNEEEIKIVTDGKGLAFNLADKGLYFEGSADGLVSTVESLVTAAVDCK